MPEDLKRICVGSVDAFHCGSGSCLTLSGRGAGTWLTLAPVAGRQWVQDLLDIPVSLRVHHGPVAFSFAVGVRACRAEVVKVDRDDAPAIVACVVLERTHGAAAKPERSSSPT